MITAAATLAAVLSSCSGTSLDTGEKGFVTGDGTVTVVDAADRQPPRAEVAGRTVAGHAGALSDLRGKVVVMPVWGSWCAPCRVEMPGIQALHRAYAAKGLKIVAVSIDDPGTEAAIRQFAEEFGLTFEILHDTAQAIVGAYQVNGYPQSFVIGRDGTIRRKWIGPENWNSPSNRSLMAALLTSPGGPGR